MPMVFIGLEEFTHAAPEAKIPADLADALKCDWREAAECAVAAEAAVATELHSHLYNRSHQS